MSGRAKHFGRQFINKNQRFTAEMLRPYEYICFHTRCTSGLAYWEVETGFLHIYKTKAKNGILRYWQW